MIQFCIKSRTKHRFAKGPKCEVCGAMNPKFDPNRNRVIGRPRKLKFKIE
jgi:hypothetical protein